jgi:hypothetical protein
MTMLCHLQPIFPEESGVDQLVEIIKVNFLVSVSFCFISFFLKVDFWIFNLSVIMYCRFWEHQQEKK